MENVKIILRVVQTILLAAIFIAVLEARVSMEKFIQKSQYPAVTEVYHNDNRRFDVQAYGPVNLDGYKRKDSVAHEK